jgi:hypothetical protein
LIELAAYVLRAGLSLVLVVAGAAKLADRGGFRATLVGLGLPLPAARAVGVVFPGVEIAVGVAGLANLAPVATDAALVLLTATFVLVSAFGAAYRPSVKCRCFGALAASAFSRRGVFRSLVLVVLASALLALSLTTPRVAEAHADTSAVVVSVATVLFAVVCLQAARAVESVRQSMQPETR